MSGAQGTPFRVGTRGSALALWQTELVRGRLHDLGHTTERLEIRTTGDAILDIPLSKIGSRALFTKQIDEAMLEGRIDLAVHSLKDLPTVMPKGIALVAVGPREDPRDAFVGRDGVTWATLPEGAGIGTGSLRRRAQLLRERPDLRIEDLRGNVDTRLAKLDAAGHWSAIILAAAGLVRLGYDARITERMPLTFMLPAPGQGAMAVTARADDARSAEVARRAFHDDATALACAAERALLRTLEGGCQVPVAAYAERQGAELVLRGRVASLDGMRAAEGALAMPVAAGDLRHADALGEALAERLLADGADTILAEVRAGAAESGSVSEP